MPQPLVALIPGAWSNMLFFGAEFQQVFTATGFQVAAIDIVPSRQRKTRWIRMLDYVRTVEARIRAIRQPGQELVLLGHSMGGRIAELIANRGQIQVDGLVLLCAVPPQGILGSTLRILRDDPMSVISSYGHLDPTQLVATPARQRARLFGKLPEGGWPRVRPESALAFLAMYLPLWPKHQVPTLVYGCEADGIISPAMVQATATAHHATAHIFPGMPHVCMLGPNGSIVATKVAADLAQLGIDS